MILFILFSFNYCSVSEEDEENHEMPDTHFHFYSCAEKNHAIDIVS